MNQRCLSILVLLAFASGVEAQIFKVITPDGRVIYTDSPPEDVQAEEVDLPDLIIEPATQVRTQPSTTSAASEQREVPLSKPSITSPTEKQVIPPGQRQVVVAAQASQQLPDGFRYILLVNGSISGIPVTSPVWTLDNPNPGEQRVQVAIIDEQGSRRILSDIRTFFVIR